MRRIALLILASIAGLAAAESPTSIGFRGDGTGAHPGANPPVEWDGTREGAYRWRCALPTHGYGCPIAVLGKDHAVRVYAVSENDAEHPYPMLTCIDLKTGEKLWERELNHVPVAVKDPATVKEIDAVWRKHLKFHGDLNELHAKFNGAKASGDKAKRLALKADFEALGLKADEEQLLATSLKGSAYRYAVTAVGEPATTLWNMQFGKRDPGAANGALLDQANLHLDQRRVRGIENLWDSFPTPVSDGERIFIMNAFDAYWCVDLDGKTLWCNWYPRDCQGDDCQNGRSPIVWRDYFIADNRAHVRAFDRKTGELVWDFRKTGTHEIASPVVMTIGGEDYLWYNGSPRGVLRCRDGKHVPIEGWKSTGMMVAVNTDSPDTVFMSGGGEHGGYDKKGKGDELSPAAIRLSLDGEKMKADVLWMGIDGKSHAANNNTIAYHRGKVYYDGAGGVILDPATGKVVAGTASAKKGLRSGAAVPETAITFLFAAERVYGFGKHGGGAYHSKKGEQPTGPLATGSCEVFDLAGKRLARNAVQAPADRDGRNVRFAADGHKLSYPYTFAIAGDALLFRSTWDVTCVGR